MLKIQERMEAIRPPTRRAETRMAIALIALGVLLRLWQYAANSSFWLDEIAIALNVVSRPLSRLIAEPLDLGQVAPVGFLAAEKMATSMLGSSERAFRLYALLCGLAALVLFWRLAARAIGGRGALFALALFAIAAPLLRYSAEAKQYGGDVVGSIALTLLALRLIEEEPTTRRCLTAGFAGVAVAIFSHVSALTMAGLGAVLAGRWLLRRDFRTARPLALTVPIWAVASLCTVVAAERSMNPETRAFMQRFWSRTGFPPLPFRVAGTAAWVAGRLQNFFAYEQLLRYPLAPLYAVAMCAGLMVLWRRRSPSVALAVYAPLFVALAAAVARRYPLESRLSLYLLPAVVLGVAATIDALALLVAGYRRKLAWAVVAAALAPPAYAIAHRPPPYRIETYRPAFAYLAQHRRPGDLVFVFRSAVLAALWYGPPNGLAAGDYVLGSCDANEPRTYLQDIDSLRGRPRVWVVSAAVPPFVPPQRNVLRYLETIGKRLEGLTVPSEFFGPSTADLFDLSDAARLQSATAATFPGEPMLAFRPSCTGPLDPAKFKFAR
jgi:hypothetical protein